MMRDSFLLRNWEPAFSEGTMQPSVPVLLAR